MADATELCFTPATELGRLYRAKALSPVEVTEAVLARLDQLNPTLNAFLTPTPDLARQEAKAAEARFQRGEPIGPLDGVPYSIKDLVATAGIRTTNGSKFHEHNVPKADGLVAARLRSTGGVLLGKTNTPHVGHKDMCDNLLGPPCQNPWQIGRTSGGSSGGAGAAVAAGIGPIAQGGDGAGSIRIPAALCGIYGIKPSYGLIAYYPSGNYWSARSHPGPMTRTVRDAAIMLQALAGPDSRYPLSIDRQPPDFLAACDTSIKGMRVVFSSDMGYAAVDDDVVELCRAAARRFIDLGCDYAERAPGWDNPYDFHKTMYTTGVASGLYDQWQAKPEWIEPSLRKMIEAGKDIDAITLNQAMNQRATFYDQVHRFFETCDILLTPGMPCGAWSAEPGEVQGPAAIGGKPAPEIFERVPFCYPFNLTGNPAAVAPCGFTREGLPVALQIVGKWHADTTVFAASAAFEAIAPWAHHRPSV